MFYSLNPGNVTVDPSKVGQAASDIRVNAYDRTTENLMADWIFTNCGQFDSKFYLPQGFHFQNVWIHFRVTFDSSSSELRINLLRPNEATMDGLIFKNNSWGFSAATTNTTTTNSYGSAEFPPDWSDFDVELLPTGAKLYINGAYVGEDTSDPSNSDLLALLIRPDASTHISEICISDQDTRGVRIQSTKPQGLGAGNTFIGNVSDLQSEPFTDAGLSSTAAGDEAHLTLPPLGLSGMQVMNVQSSLQGDISGSPESPVLLHVLFDGTTEHILGCTYHTADSEHVGSHVNTAVKEDGSMFTQAELNSGELRLKNVVAPLVSTISNISSSAGEGYHYSNSTLVHGARNFIGQDLDHIAVSKDGKVKLTTFSTYAGSETTLDLTLGASNGPVFKFTGIPKSNSYSFELTGNDQAKILGQFLKDNPDNHFVVLEANFY